MKKIFTLLLLFIIVLLIFRQWILSNEIIGGDWPYFFNERLKEFTLFPPAWSPVHSNGLGGTILTYYLDQYLYFTVYLSTNILHIPWVIGYKLFWFGLFIILSIFSSIYLLKTIFSQAELWQVGLTALIFTANTYILMVVGGGQMGVGLAYSIVPLILATFVKLIDLTNSPSFNFKLSVIAGLALALQIMFDPRVAYLSIIAVAIYAVFNTAYNSASIRSIKKNILYTFTIPIGIAVLLHSYWIFPLLRSKTLPIPEGFINISEFDFFSFADFSHALSLLHPNWPENIFGKTYFLDPKSLILPILAFSSLFFLKGTMKQSSNLPAGRQGRTIVFFSFLSILGAFLAKGTNEPLGQINDFLFKYFPGMQMFRDPTKFYLLIVLSYSILISFSTYSIYKWLSAKLQSKVKSYIPKLFLLFAIFYLLFLIRPALFGQLGGTFRHHNTPKEYVELKDFLNSQNQFFRTLWVPRQQRFAYASNIHPAIEAMPLFEATNSTQLIDRLKTNESRKYLSNLSVKYVIIPYDSIEEIFLKDRKYNEKQRIDLEKQLDNIPWLRKINTGKITVYETQSYQNHFWLDGEGKVIYRMLSPTTYDLDIKIPQATKLVFSENFSSFWTAKIGNSNVLSKDYKGINSFDLNKTGHNRVRVFFSQEKEYILGRATTLITFFILVIFLISTRHSFISSGKKHVR